MHDRSITIVKRSRVLIAAALAIALGVLGLDAVAASPVTADTATPLPATVSADALPTWQVNGVVWSQVVVGNTVYATGSFSAARPPGVAVGGAGQVQANNIFAYDITTGNRVASFSHQLNGQGLTVVASPDGSKVYVGGDFTTVDGVARNHIAAFNVATGALDTRFAPSVGSSVAALAVSPSTVYAGGKFFSAGGQSRRRLAAFSASNGAVLPWAPTADDNNVSAMVMAPDDSHVIVGGKFTTLDGVSATGMGSLDATSGAVLPWKINQLVRDGGDKCGITNLSVDGDQVYGGGFAFGCGNFEGTFAANAGDGTTSWVNDCHGDTYSTYPVGQVLYSVSHAHSCQWIGAFSNSDPWSVNMRHALAFTTYPTGTDQGPDDYGWDFSSVADSTLLQWFPLLGIGSYTGQNQAAWSVSGNSNYVVLGGEFPTANRTAQQGLVRFAVRNIAPNKRGPAAASGADKPTAVSFGGGTARIAWQAPYDMDDKTLSYNIYRSGTAAPIATMPADSTYWNHPMLGYLDKSAVPGQSYTYTVKASDPWGNTLNLGSSNSVTVVSGTTSLYVGDVTGDGAQHYWRLGEPSGTTVYDWAGFADGLAQGGVSRGVPGAIGGDSDAASGFNGTSTGYVSTGSTDSAPANFTLEAWVKTTTTSGGKIVGYGSANTGDSSSYDRHIYMDNAGHLIFGIYRGGTYTITTPNRYNDGQWHQIVATLDSSVGMKLFVDGTRVGVNQSGTVAQDYSGYWRIGGDNLNGWPSQPSSNYFNGAIDDVAVYDQALSLTNVRTHYIDSGRTLNLPAAPADTYGKAVYDDDPDLFWRLDEAAGATANDSSANGAVGIYAGGVTLGQAGALGGQGTAATFDGTSGTVGAATAVGGPSVYSEELWFKTTTTHGGKLIGFGDRQSGTSGNYDRHVYMENSGQLTFGVWTGQTNTITSPASYNDGRWHYLVATQGPAGMKLYVDNTLIGTNPQTGQQAYTGYWRVGGDTVWSGDSNFFAGTIDEVAVYSKQLSPLDVRSHFLAGGGTVANDPPVASFTLDQDARSITVDASGSSDPDGSVASYAWDFGDGSTAHGQTATHTFTAPGDYTVKLTVTDDVGATASATKQVHVTNSPPIANFVATASGLSVAVDGSSSGDPDGTVTSSAWDFGDGATGTGVKVAHTYAAAGTYTISLTVTDNDGATASTQQQVSVTAQQAPQLLASDNFGRTVTGGWGSADTGGAWSVTGNSANAAVSNGSASLTDPRPGAGPSVTLGGVSSQDTDVRVSLAPGQVPDASGAFISLIGRQVGTTGAYRAVVNLTAAQQVTIALVRVDAAGQARIADPVSVSGLTYAPGTVLDARFVVTGSAPTTLEAKVWRHGDPEPSGWQVSGADNSAAMQAAGTVGLMSYLSTNATQVPFAVRFSAFRTYDATTDGAAQAVADGAQAMTARHVSKDVTGTARTSPDLGKGAAPARERSAK